jgi:hypothetical protein
MFVQKLLDENSHPGDLLDVFRKNLRQWARREEPVNPYPVIIKKFIAGTLKQLPGILSNFAEFTGMTK